MVEPKKSIVNLKPYLNGSHSAELIRNHKKILKLDSNEATVSPSPKVVGAIMQYVQSGPVNWYPDVESSELCERLARYVGIPETYLLSFNGSDHALETVARAYLSIDDEVIQFTPTYDHFRIYVESCDARLVSLEEAPGLRLKEVIGAAVTGCTRMVYLVNPNNPTGTLIPRDQIEETLVALPDIIFIVDEAYFEFCGATVSDLVIDHKNLLVTRSFSKAFGLAGLRCGYLIAWPETCAHVGKIRIGKNINAVAQVAACAALDDIDYMERYVTEVNVAKKWLVRKLRAQGLEVRETPANFILLRIAHPARVMDYLESQNIYIRDRSFLPQLRGFIRLTIGHLHLMKRVWRAFEGIPQNFLHATTELRKA